MRYILTESEHRMQASEVTPITAGIPLIGVFPLILMEVVLNSSDSSVQTLDWVPLYPAVPNSLA